MGPPHRVRRELRRVARATAIRVTYGSDTPRWRQPVTVRLADCAATYNAPDGRSVVGGDWDLKAHPLDGYFKLEVCRRHWEDGLSWEQTGIYDVQMRRIREHGSFDGCSSREDVVRRYANLDRLYEQVQREGRLRPAEETGAGGDGVLFHIGRDARPVFGHRGGHRFVVGLLVGLEGIPAELGMVHPDAVRGWRHSASVSVRHPG